LVLSFDHIAGGIDDDAELDGVHGELPNRPEYSGL
jgi:hypothetical protein